MIFHEGMFINQANLKWVYYSKNNIIHYWVKHTTHLHVVTLLREAHNASARCYTTGWGTARISTLLHYWVRYSTHLHVITLLGEVQHASRNWWIFLCIFLETKCKIFFRKGVVNIFTDQSKLYFKFFFLHNNLLQK